MSAKNGFGRELKEQLELLDHQIVTALETHRDLPDDARTFVQAGKRLRARCLLASAVRPRSQESNRLLIQAATAIELFHAGSLLHDDIVDRCALRRGKPTISSIAGPHAAAQLGVHLADLALDLSANLPKSAAALFADTARDVSRGQLTELLRAFDVTLTPDDRMTIMAQKTASVFGLACELGALISGASHNLKGSLRDFGRSCGVLFQIADDVDDLFATERQVGRAPGTDLEGGVISLPLAFALSTETASEMAALVERVSDSGFARALARCRRLVRDGGALRRTYETALRYAESAHEALARSTRAGGASWLPDLVADTLARIEKRL